ncbi:MAG: NAD(P)/FAD-dependent oxidoreductase [Rhizobiaceae bacterium]|nr:NAD(P)/FAD-dependent oxidoreductase [Rhizobiaceae bacterium]
MSDFDAVVIGGGHNGLVCAAFLAKAGRKVVVLEAAGETGGGGHTREFAPDFRVSALAHIVNRLHPEVVRALELERHGLAASSVRQPASVALSAAGDPLVLEGAYGETLQGAAPAEQAAWTEVRAQLFRYAGILKPLLARRPPSLGGMALTEAAGLAMTGLSLKRLGREDMRDFLRVLLMNVADFADEGLSDPRLKGLLAFDAVLGSHMGPRSPTSLLGLYYRLTGEHAAVAGGQMIPAGGMAAVTGAIRKAAEAAGVTIRTAAEVSSIEARQGRATAAVLAGGERIAAGTIISAINPRTTFLDLVGPSHLDTGFVRRIGNIRMKGDAAKLHLALDRAPEFTGLPLDRRNARLVIAPSPDHVERAFNPAKYGEFSPEPVMEIVLPSINDPSLAPAGACVLSAVVQYAPYALKEGWQVGKPRFMEAILSVLEAHAPGIGRTIVHAELLTPADIEREFRMPGGHWHHGELQADQMLMSRPAFGAEGYDTPLDGLFLAGAGSHPGGGISGVPGMNAAKRVLGIRDR